jgi:hypothetical protein
MKASPIRKREDAAKRWHLYVRERKDAVPPEPPEPVGDE